MGLCKKICRAESCFLTTGWDRKKARGILPGREREEVAIMELPKVFLDRMKALLGGEFSDYLACMEQPPKKGVRLNPLKCDWEILEKSVPFVLSPTPFSPLCRTAEHLDKPGLLPAHHAGMFYSQEPSASSAVTVLDPQPGENILDLCAAPGGKSTQIAGLLRGKGLLWANEIVRSRASALLSNLERMGAENAVVSSCHPQKLCESLRGYFDRVLVDAPCSGEGMFRKEEAAVTDWSPETVRMCAARQREILNRAAGMLRPGGRLVYSTCTFSREENEETVAAFLESHPEFSPEQVEAPWFEPGENGSFRLWPHKLLGEGHFAAVLRKDGGTAGTLTPEKGRKLPPCWEDFARDAGVALPEGKGLSFGATICWTPEETPSLDGLRVLRPGLELGTLRGDRLQPAHALALWLTPGEKAVHLPLDGTELPKYLHGETLPGTARGYVVICAGDHSLGWAKGDGTTLKNHYPKGLRR